MLVPSVGSQENISSQTLSLLSAGDKQPRKSSTHDNLCSELCLSQLSLCIQASMLPEIDDNDRRRTNVQQLTCNIDSSNSFYYLFFSFVLIELKPFVLRGKILGKNSEKV